MSLLVAVVRQRAQLQRQCLDQLCRGQWVAACQTAHAACRISSDPESLRRLAVAALLAGSAQTALRILRENAPGGSSD